MPAYDEALSFLSSHSASLAAKIATVDTDHASLSADERAALKESLEIAAAINDPAMLAAFQASSPTGYDARNPAFRHLRERVWRKDSGVLEKVMQRCTLMHVLPDVIPAITPTVDVQLAFGEGDDVYITQKALFFFDVSRLKIGQGDGFTDHQSNGGDVLVGAFVPASASITPPKLDVTVFHTQPKRYTLAIVDPDQPDEQNQCFTTSLLALKHDVELSATAHSSIDLASNMVAEYIPPHPQQGSNYHRYTVLLFEQPSSPSSEQSAIDIAKNRHNFQLANYISTHNLVPAGIHFWRAKWSPDSADAISTIYRDILSKYLPPPFPFPFPFS